jgi:hypothetical protein
MAFENVGRGGPSVDHNLIASIGSGANAARLQGTQTRALEQQMQAEQAQAAKAEQFNQLAAGLVSADQVAGALPPDEEARIMGELYSLDSAAASNLLGQRQQQQVIDDQMVRDRAAQIVPRMQAVLQSETPAQALRLFGRMPDGADLIEKLTEEGLINPDDGISDDEARTFAQAMVDDQSPFLTPPEARAEPSFIREMRAVGIDPDSAEGKQVWLDKQMRDGATDQQIEGMRLMLLKNQFDREASEAAEAARTAEQGRKTATFEINSTLSHLEEAAELNRKLANTFLRTGAAGRDWRNIALGTAAEISAALGVPRPEAEQAKADYSRLSKLTSELMVGSMGRVAGSGLGSATNDRIGLLTQSMASVENDPRANELVIADALEALVSSGEIEGLDINDRDKYVGLAENLREGTITAPDRTVVDAPAAATAAKDAAKGAAQNVIDLGQGVKLEFID